MPGLDRSLGSLRSKWLRNKPTMFEKLKSLEMGMDPARQHAMDSVYDNLMGRGTTNNPWEQAPTLPPPDPDVEAMYGARRGLTPISTSPLADTLMRAVGRR